MKNQNGSEKLFLEYLLGELKTAKNVNNIDLMRHLLLSTIQNIETWQKEEFPAFEDLGSMPHESTKVQAVRPVDGGVEIPGKPLGV